MLMRISAHTSNEARLTRVIFNLLHYADYSYRLDLKHKKRKKKRLLVKSIHYADYSSSDESSRCLFAKRTKFNIIVSCLPIF